jgi:hypothetical protein
MKNKIILYVVITLIIGLAAGYLINKATNNFVSDIQMGNDNNIVNKNNATIVNTDKENCLSDDCLSVNDLEYPISGISEDAKNALNRAIDDEYKAFSVYEKTIEKFGMVRPFSMIIRAEESHISSLKALFDKYGLEIPKNNWTGKIIPENTLREACQTGVEAEIANAKLYKEELLPLVVDYEDITIVFTNLMDASQQKHLVAFEKCN